MKLGLVDLNTGNLASLESAINKLNVKFKICKNSFDFEDVDKIILPGVGAFKDFMNKLENSGIHKIVIQKIKNNIPILGVCVGFQVLFTDSKEHGLSNGLNILEGNIFSYANEKFNIASPKQLGDILFAKMKLSDKPKKTKSGQFATGESELLKLKGKHKIIDDIPTYTPIEYGISAHFRFRTNQSYCFQ